MKWTRPLVQEALRRWRRCFGVWPSQIDWTPSQARKRGRTAQVTEWERGGYPHASAARRAFREGAVAGSWHDVMAAVSSRPATLPYTRLHRRKRRWSRDEIIEAVQRWADEHDGRPPSYQEWDPAMAKRRGRPDMADEFYGGVWPPASVACRRTGGSWNELVAAAGFDPRAPGAISE